MQDINNVRSIIETTKANLEVELPQGYLNYLKTIAYPNHQKEAYARPYTESSLSLYDIVNEDQEYDLVLPAGEHALLIFPDVIITKELSNFVEQIREPVVTFAYDYDCKTGSIQSIGKRRIVTDNVEKYRNISTFLIFDEPIKTETAFTKAEFKPQLHDVKDQDKSDLRLLPVFKDMLRSDTPLKTIAQTKTLRYVSRLSSSDEVGLVEKLPINIPVENAPVDGFFEKMKGLITEKKTEDEVKQITNMEPRLLAKLIKTVSQAELLQYAQVPKVPCLFLHYNIDHPVRVELYTKMELFKYNDAIHNYSVSGLLKNSGLVRTVVNILQICYFMNLEEIINMFIKNNGIVLNIPKKKDRDYLHSLAKSSDSVNLLGILVKLWMVQKDKTEI
jgi:hypothetical protein